MPAAQRRGRHNFVPGKVIWLQSERRERERRGEEGRTEGELLGFYAAASRLTRPSVRPSAPLSNAALSLAANEDVYLARPEKKSASRCSFLHSCQLEGG